MDAAAHAVAAEFAHHLKPAAVGLLLYGAADVVDPVPCPGGPRGEVKSTLGTTGQSQRRLAGGTGGDGNGGVGKVSVLFGDEVELHQVAGLDHAAAGDPVDGLSLTLMQKSAGKP